jgi:hypothetical protein
VPRRRVGSGDGRAAMTRRPFSADFAARVACVATLVVLSHSLPWNALRLATSECVLRLSEWLGMAAARVSFDTLRINGQLFEYVTSCTFVDVFMGSIPLLWNRLHGVGRNAAVVLLCAVLLFGLNVIRLELAQWLFAQGYSWVASDQLLGGVCYFLVWLALWRTRSWQVFEDPLRA